MQLELVDTAYDDELAAELIAEVQQEYVVRYGGVDGTPVDAAEFAPPGGAFLLAFLGDDPVGCVGLRRHDDRTVELKRMYIRREHRRRGHGRAMLHAVEDRARTMGYRRLVLETGTGQPEALALYTDARYEPITGYGYYRDSPMARYFAKPL